LKTLQVYTKKIDSIKRRHPWIFSGAISSDVSDFENGDLVKVTDNKGVFLAIGHFQHATISVRILTFEEKEIDLTFFVEKLNHAYNLRTSLNLLHTQNTIFRLVHGEGDGLPGLIIDFYNGVAVVQCHSIGMYRSLDLISSALQHVLDGNLVAIYSKSSDTLPSKHIAIDEYLFGSCSTPHVAMENGIQFNIDWIHGQKTGFFIDQRENRNILGKIANGKKILNTFCYSGGFSLYALQNGAELTHSLDSSKKAIELTEQNVELNNFQKSHESIIADAMEYMKSAEKDYDIIILDPPAFAKHRDKKHKAVQGYKRLNAMAINSIKSGGLLFTFSCSQVIDKNLFTNTIIAAAIETQRNVRIIGQLHQPADHPINAFHPEGEYLKGLILEVN
jgi:23S rRNA (cytosine1962-C5)-methyltransferase